MPRKLIDPPSPGVYPDVPAALYHSWRAFSNTQAGHLVRSPAHLEAYLAADEDPDTLALGRAIHTATLEPDVWRDRTIRGPSADPNAFLKADGTPPANVKATKAFKEAVASARRVADELGFEYVDPDVYDNAVRVAEAVDADVYASGLLKGSRELSIVWVDEPTGVTCKARLDGYREDLRLIADLKSARDAREAQFGRWNFGKFGYHRQAAFYLRGAAAVGLDAEAFIVIAVEHEPPFGLRCYNVSRALIEYTGAQVDAILAVYAECLARDFWPKYPSEVVEFGSDDFILNQVDRETETVREFLGEFDLYA